MNYGRNPGRNKFLADYFGYGGDFGQGQFGAWTSEKGIGQGDVKHAIGLFEGKQELAGELDWLKKQMTGIDAERQALFDSLERSQQNFAKSAAEFEQYKRKQALGLGSGIDNRLMTARFTQAGRSAGRGLLAAGINAGAGARAGIGFL